MNRLLTILLLLLMVVNVTGQYMRRQEADSLFKLLGKGTPDINRVNLLLRLAEFQIFKPGENKTDLDSAASFISQAKLLNGQVKSAESYGFQILIESCLMREEGKETPAKEMAEKALQLLKNGNNKLYLGKAYFILSQYYNYGDHSQFLIKISLLEQAKLAFQQSGDTLQKANCLKMLADLHVIQGQYVKALEELQECLKDYQAVNHKELQGVYDLIGTIYDHKTDYKQALTYRLLSLKTAENVHDSTMQLCEINNNIGLLYTALSEIDKALIYFIEAVKIAERYQSNSDIYFITTNIAGSYLKLNKPAEGLNFLEMIAHKYQMPKDDIIYFGVNRAYIDLYAALRLFDKAKPHCQNLINMSRRPDLKEIVTNSIYSTLAKFYIASKQFQLASLYLAKNSLLSEKLGNLTYIQNNYKSRFMLDTAQRNYKSAVFNLLQFNKISDSLFNITKSNQVRQLEIEYETGKKEDSLKLKDKDLLVLNQRYQLQQSNLQKATLLKNVTGVGILLLIIIVGLLIRQYRHKQQSNLVISSKNEILEHLLVEKEWLLKEIHHRVKNNLQIIISLLNTQSNYLENEAAIKAIRESQERMNAISLIHQKLYKSEDAAFINIKEYVHELVEHIRNGFNASSGIVFELNITDSQMDVAQAVPLGLILNEAISNAVKYAFPGQPSGRVSISISHSFTDDNYVLTVTDNGAGLPPDYDLSKKASFGIRLMQGLSKQLSGSFTIESDNGVKINVAFAGSRISRLFEKKKINKPFASEIQDSIFDHETIIPA